MPTKLPYRIVVATGMALTLMAVETKGTEATQVVVTGVVQAAILVAHPAAWRVGIVERS